MGIRLTQLGNMLLKPPYVLLTVSVAWMVFTFAVWLPNTRLIGVVLLSGTASISEKLSFLLSLYGSIGTNFTPVSASYTIIISVLFGLNISLLTYYIRKVRSGMKGISSTGVAGLGGLMSGVLGIGCAACGTFILTSVLTLFGVSGIIAYLPLGGEEFGLLGVGLLLYSLYILSKKIAEPLLCRIKE